MPMCPHKHENPYGYTFCGVCGAAILPPIILCANGHESPQGQNFCGQCGLTLGESHRTNPPARTPSSALEDADQVTRRLALQAHPPPVVKSRNIETSSRGDRSNLRAPGSVGRARRDLRVGNRVQVLDRGDEDDGKIGVVVEVITDNADGYVVWVDLDGEGESLYAFRQDELTLVAPETADDSGSPSEPEGAYSSALEVGDTVQVVNSGDEDDGKVGIVKEIADTAMDYDVLVDLEGNAGMQAFSSETLRVIDKGEGGERGSYLDVDAPVAEAGKTRWSAGHPNRRVASSANGWSSRSPGVRLGIAVLVVAILGMSALLLRGCLRADTSSSPAVSGSGGDNSSAVVGPQSTLDDWLAAVCKPGTYDSSGNHLQNADVSGWCLSRFDNGPIMIGLYTSKFGLKNDVSLFRGSTSATLNQIDGRICLFLAVRSATALQPLTQFGFQLDSSP